MLGDALGEALAPERAQLDFSHVQPGPVLGRVVDFKPVGQAFCFCRRERLVKRGRRVGVELIHHQHHALGVAVASVEQVANEHRPVAAAAVRGCRHVPPARQRLAGHEQACDPVAGVNVVVALDRPGPGGQGVARFADQLLEGFVHADHGPLRVVWAVIHLQHVFHMEDELSRVLGRDAPHPA